MKKDLNYLPTNLLTKNPSPQPSPARGEGAKVSFAKQTDKISSPFTPHSSLKHENPSPSIPLPRRGKKVSFAKQTVKNLSPITHSPVHPSPKRKAAFTLAEVLITLAIVGVVAALVMPGIINNIQKHKTVTVLKRAYSDLHSYLKMFDSEFYCDGDLMTCAPTNSFYYHAFVIKFSQYLEDKQRFKNFVAPGNGQLCRWHVIMNKGVDYLWAQGCSDPINSSRSGYILVSPTGEYAYWITPYMYDNNYNAPNPKIRGTYRARIFIITDLKHFKHCSSSCTANDRAKALEMGKGAFEVFITNKEFILPQGFPECGRGYYCHTLIESSCSQAKGGDRHACMQKIIEDGWQIKYDY